MESPDYSVTLQRFTGFAQQYNAARPTAPAELAALLCPIAQCERPRLVVDLGSGTGLSTRYWGEHAEAVIGIEPTDSMRQEAERLGPSNITFRKGYSHDTGLENNCADLVICAQSLHWMEPFGTFAEARRILRPGGVFAAYDYDWPPSTPYWEVDEAYLHCVHLARELEAKHGLSKGLHQWDKAGHLTRMKESNSFRYIRESLLHHKETGGHERIVGLLLSQGHVQTALKAGFTESDLQVDRLANIAAKAFGPTPVPWFWSARIRLGVK